MPRQGLDQALAVEAISEVLSELTGVTQIEYINNPPTLIEDLKAIRFPWEQAAAIANISKSKLYHWFRETYCRQEKNELLPVDAQLIKKLVFNCLDNSNQLILDDIKSKLSQEYDSQVVYIAFHNAQKTWKNKNMSGDLIIKSTSYEQPTEPEKVTIPILPIDKGDFLFNGIPNIETFSSRSSAPTFRTRLEDEKADFYDLGYEQEKCE